jgi:ABC-type sugar transport system substrate-binding protein
MQLDGRREENMDRRKFNALALAGLGSAGWTWPNLARAAQRRTVALLFDSMVAPYWVQSLTDMKSEADKRGWLVLQAVSDLDDNRQFQQLKSMIERKVDGVVIIQTDKKAVIPAIRAANKAGIPMVHYDRAPAENDAYSVAIVSDSRKLMRQTVETALDAGKSKPGKRKAVILVGSLADQNAVDRLNGFRDAVKERADQVEVVAEIPTDWKIEKHFSGLTNALQSTPDLDFVTVCSDAALPTIEQVLKTANRWTRTGEPGHVYLASFDGDENGYKAASEGFVDAIGVQDMQRDVELTFGALEAQWKGEKPSNLIYDDKVYILTPANAVELRDKIWGYRVLTAQQAKK